MQLAERALAAASPVLRGHVIEVGAATAGGAREAACAAAVAATGRPVSEVWLATTDADSTVAPDWLIAQLRWARRGLHGVAGLVHIDGELPVEIRRARVHPNVATAAVSVIVTCTAPTSDCAASSGKSSAASCPCHWAKTNSCGRRREPRGAALLGVDDVIVTTSGRRVGRTPGGFARFLDGLAS